VLVLGGVQVGPQGIRRFPQGGLEAEVGPVAVGCLDLGQGSLPIGARCCSITTNLPIDGGLCHVRRSADGGEVRTAKQTVSTMATVPTAGTFGSSPGRPHATSCEMRDRTRARTASRIGSGRSGQDRTTCKRAGSVAASASLFAARSSRIAEFAGISGVVRIPPSPLDACAYPGKVQKRSVIPGNSSELAFEFAATAPIYFFSGFASQLASTKPTRQLASRRQTHDVGGADFGMTGHFAQRFFGRGAIEIENRDRCPTGG
jgi:hypothetical protein